MSRFFWSLRVVVFYLGLIPVTMIFAILAGLVAPLPAAWRYWIITRWSYFFVWWVKVSCGLAYRVLGKENLPLTACVVLANHQSTWETIFMQVLLPPQTWILKKELLHIPFFGWGLALLQPIAIDRRNKFAVKSIVTQGKTRLSAGRWVLIYPEGTRVAVGEQKSFSRTGAALAIAAEVPVVPIAHNAGVFWPRGVWLKQPGVITVRIGAVIDPQGKTAEEITAAAQQWIQAQDFGG